MRRLGDILADTFAEMTAELARERASEKSNSPVLTFGKWRGHTIRAMVASDPDYAAWLIRQPNIKEYQPELCRQIVREYMARRQQHR